MRTHVLTFAKLFMNDHPKAGDPTWFREKIKRGEKIHTIRSNYDYWEPKVQDVANANANLSLRYWKGKPYRSKQEEFYKVMPKYEPWFQKIRITDLGCIYVSGEMQTRHEVAKNDGLTHNDFHAWFGDNLPFEGIIIHFTDFRY